MEIDFSKYNDIEHYGDKKIELIELLNKSANARFDPKTREDAILKRLCEFFHIKIDFHVTRKFAKKVIKIFVCCESLDAKTLKNVLIDQKYKPNHLEVKSLKKRISNEDYNELTQISKIDIPHEGLIAIGLSKNFYQSREWKQVRYQALRIYKNFCQCCGRKRSENLWLEVDHIKPRSLAPELALDISNLQILCSDCNQGKSNLDCTDWRD